MWLWGIVAVPRAVTDLEEDAVAEAVCGYQRSTVTPLELLGKQRQRGGLAVSHSIQVSSRRQDNF